MIILAGGLLIIIIVAVGMMMGGGGNRKRGVAGKDVVDVWVAKQPFRGRSEDHQGVHGKVDDRPALAP